MPFFALWQLLCSHSLFALSRQHNARADSIMQNCVQTCKIFPRGLYHNSSIKIKFSLVCPIKEITRMTFGAQIGYIHLPLILTSIARRGPSSLTSKDFSSSSGGTTTRLLQRKKYQWKYWVSHNTSISLIHRTNRQSDQQCSLQKSLCNIISLLLTVNV